MKKVNIIPPYCNDSSILESCNLCKDSPCIKICDESIIKKDAKGIYLDFEKNGCSFCEKCAIVCKEESFGLLNLNLGKQIFTKIKINQVKCLAWNKTLCSYCGDICENKSIKFIANLYPEILESCTKCGMCKSVCPTDCIEFKS